MHQTTIVVLKIALLSAAVYFGIKCVVSAIDPTKEQKLKAKEKAEKIMKKLGIKNSVELSLYELMIASNLVEPESIPVMWSDIAGLGEVVQELRETVIFPLKKKNLLANSQLLQPPRGILLHGPPGCGKTMIAKATAHEAGANFINLDVASLMDKWYGESQKLAVAVFTFAMKIQPCIIFIDEIDSLLRVRDQHDHEATSMIKTQFMAQWDGLSTSADCRVVVMGATNRPQDVDKAILRRMPATFYVGMPNIHQRRQILRLILQNEPLSSDVDLNRLAKITDNFCGSDLRELCRRASMCRVREYMKSEEEMEFPDVASDDGEVFHDTLRPVTMEDLLICGNKMKESKMHCGMFPLVHISLD